MTKLLLLPLLLILFNCGPITTLEQNLLPESRGETLSHKDYTFDYSEEHEQSYWVAYLVELAEINGNTKRSDDYREDSLVSTGSATLDDYRHSGFDRGHLAPAAVMKEDSLEMSESFYLTNISPQVAGFNRGIWKDLEELVRSWVREYGDMYVVTGPVLADKLRYIGKNRVSVPDYFYKIIYSPTYDLGVAFLLANKSSSKDLTSFIVTIDSVEALTGNDFFHKLTHSHQRDLESIKWNGWR